MKRLSLNLAKLSLISIIFLCPLVGNTKFGFEQTKVFLFFGLVNLSLIGLLFSGEKLKLKWSRVKLASIIFIISLFISSYFGIDKQASLLGRDPYLQGAFLYLFLFIFSVLIGTLKPKLIAIAGALGASGLIVSLVVIWQWIELNVLGLNIQNYSGRPISTFGQPNFYSGFLILVIPFLIYLGKNKRFTLTSYLLVAIFLLAIIMSGSRVVLAMFTLGALIWFGKKLKNWKKITAGFIVVLLIAISVGVWQRTGIFYDEFFKPYSRLWLNINSPEKRTLIWPIMLDIGIKKPILGYGLENIGEAFFVYEPPWPPPPQIFSLKKLYIDRAHNFPLDLFIFGGGFALATFIYLNYLLIKRSNGLLKASLLTYLIWILFQNQSLVHLIYFWLLVGLISEA